MNGTEQERSSSRVSQEVEEWCKCWECESLLTEKEEAASHYLNGKIRGGSRNFRNFVPSKLKIFATNYSRFPGYPVSQKAPY